jgi:CRISPR/Cas system CSM-associated protein Csm2 small subunit
MKNKKLQMEYVLESTHMIKQFIAFVLGLKTIQSTIFYKYSSREEQVQINSDWKIINHNMPDLFPLTHYEKELLLATHSTIDFKKL